MTRNSSKAKPCKNMLWRWNPHETMLAQTLPNQESTNRLARSKALTANLAVLWSQVALPPAVGLVAYTVV